MIVRSPRPEENFTTLSNSVIRDKNLSYRARGVLIEILSRPDNWRVTSVELARGSKEGRDAIRSALNEIQEAGYMVTRKIRNELGQFETFNYVFDIPQSATTDFQASVLQASDSQALLEEPTRKTIKNKDMPEIKIPSNGFEEFWAIYPRHEDKKTAQVAFIKALKKTDLETILAGARRYLADKTDLKYVAYPATWLNKERWNDESISSQPEVLIPTKTAPRFDSEEFFNPKAVPMPDFVKKSLKKVYGDSDEIEFP